MDQCLWIFVAIADDDLGKFEAFLDIFSHPVETEEAEETQAILAQMAKQRALEVLRTDEWKEEGLWS